MRLCRNIVSTTLTYVCKLTKLGMFVN